MAVEFVENRLLPPFCRDEGTVSVEDALIAIIGERDKAMTLLPYFTIHDIKVGDWPAPDLDDTQLGESSLSLELHRAQIPDRRVPSL